MCKRRQFTKESKLEAIRLWKSSDRPTCGAQGGTLSETEGSERWCRKQPRGVNGLTRGRRRGWDETVLATTP